MTRAACAAAVLTLTACEVGSATKGKSPYRAPVAGNSGITPNATSAEVGTFISVSISVKDRGGFGIPNITPTVTATNNATGSSSGVVSHGCSVTDQRGATVCTLTAGKSGDYTIKTLTPVQISTGTVVSFYQVPRSITVTPSVTTIASRSSTTFSVALTVKDAMGVGIDGGATPISAGGTGGPNTVSISSAGVLSAGTTSGSAGASGALTLSGLKIDTAGSQTITATMSDSVGGTITGTGTITVTAGTATRLGFSTQPPTSTATNNNFSPAPVVAVMDAAGNTVTSSSSCVVALSLHGGSASDNLLGSLSKTATSGLADFSGMNLRVSTTAGGTAYTLVATPGTGCSTLASGVSDPFTVTTAGLPAQLSLVQAPGTSPLNMVWTTQPVVQVLDSSGTKVGDDGTTVITITKSAGPTGTIVGSTSVRVTSGEATFSGLKTTGSSLASVGTYTLTISAVSPGITIPPITVRQTINANGLTPANLSFNVSPQNVAVNQPMSTVVVQTNDSSNFYCFNDNTTQVQLQFVSGPSGSLLSADVGFVAGTSLTNPVTVVNGLASFTGISGNTAGTYTINAVASGLTDATDATFAVSSFATADHLTFTQTPLAAGHGAGVVFAPAPIIAVQDAFGNTVTSGYTGTITMDCVVPISGCSLLGTLSVTVVNGVANFTGTNLRSNQATGTTLTIRATPSPALPNPGPFTSTDFKQ